MRRYLIKILPILLLLISVSTMNPWTNFVIGNTFIWYFVYFLNIICFVKAKRFFFDNKQNIGVIYVYVSWIVLCIFRGLFVANNYWQWKNLTSTSMFLLMPLSIYIFTNKLFVQKVIIIWLKYALPAFFLFYIVIFTEAIGRYLIPVSFLLLFFPVIPKKWKYILIFFTLIVFTSDLTARSNLIKFIVPILLSSLFYFRKLIGNQFFGIARFLLLFFPMFLFTLGVTGVFNVFNMKEYIGDYKVETQEAGGGEGTREGNLTIDTRTFLYVEVLESALKNEYIISGRTPARGNDSKAFGVFLAKELKMENEERFDNEVSILNIFTWTGFIGVILYFMIFFKATYLGIYKSKNIFMKILGLYVSFRWAYAWVEDFSRFNISNIYLWITIGMCFSNSFRSMSNKEFVNWLRCIFDQRYREFISMQKIKSLTTDYR